MDWGGWEKVFTLKWPRTSWFWTFYLTQSNVPVEGGDLFPKESGSTLTEETTHPKVVQTRGSPLENKTYLFKSHPALQAGECWFLPCWTHTQTVRRLNEKGTPSGSFKVAPLFPKLELTSAPKHHILGWFGCVCVYTRGICFDQNYLANLGQISENAVFLVNKINHGSKPQPPPCRVGLLKQKCSGSGVIWYNEVPAIYILTEHQGSSRESEFPWLLWN